MALSTGMDRDPAISTVVGVVLQWMWIMLQAKEHVALANRVWVKHDFSTALAGLASRGRRGRSSPFSPSLVGTLRRLISGRGATGLSGDSALALLPPPRGPRPHRHS